MNIIFSTTIIPKAAQIIALYDNAGLSRPTKDADRIQKMYENSDIVVTAWHNEQLVGVARSITDWVWSCYLSDLAVLVDYQKEGIGKKLIKLTKEILGEESMILLVSAPTAIAYYPKVGFKEQGSCFLINRTK